MSDDYRHREDPTLDRAEAKIIQHSYPGVSMSDHTVGKIEQLTHAPAPTSDEGTPTHLLTDERTGQVGVDAGLLKKVGRDMYEVVGNAHAPTGDATPLARAAVGEFEQEFGKSEDFRGTITRHFCDSLEVRDWLLATLFRVEAAARAEERKECWHKEFETRGIIAEAVRKEERERVWKLAYASTRNSYSKDSPQVGELGFRMIEIVNAGIIQGQVIKAALADGIDLTSLADEQ